MRADTSELSRFAAQLAAAPNKAETLTGRVLTASGTHIAAEAQRHAPVRTGYLRNSIGCHEDGPLTVLVEATANYARYVEEGTSRMSGQPFMKPALEKELPVMVKAVNGVADVIVR
ncbi:HK97-gp10 family putative phage morphogenesis protein [Rothia koreensis]|uniref:HK97-gp10 family putative phage morphogenesis protein n=1 Tax=Rothia koreensis TaxID=592378 RepID=UPI0037CA4977